MPNKKTNEQFKKEVFDLVGDEYTFLEEYVNADTKIKVRHNKCNNVYGVRPYKFINQKRRCPFCFGNIKKTNEQFKKEVFNLVGDEYTFLEEYVNAKTKLKVLHNKCKKKYKVTPHDFLDGNHRCPYCSEFRYFKLTNEEFNKRVFDLVGNEYTFLEEYINTNTKIKVRHNVCNNVYSVRPNDFLINNNRCPYCKISKGEENIKKWLEKNNIKYKWRYRGFKNCKFKRSLEFDFYLEDLNICIEYDGIQHFEECWYSDLKNQQKRDEIKNNYCKKNNIKLIRISYNEFKKIDNILSTEVFS